MEKLDLITKSSGWHRKVLYWILFSYCHIISLGAEGGTMKGKMIEKIEVQGGAFKSTPRAR